MFGWIVIKNTINDNNDIGWMGNCKSIIYKEYIFLYNPMNKFKDDKLFFEDNEKIVLLDGVVFNKQELCSRFDKDWKHTFENLLKKNEDYFMDSLRGSFCGVVLYKKNDKIIAFTNHSGERTVYYTEMDRRIIITSHCSFLRNYYKNIGKKLEPCREAHYELLITGSILFGKTPFNGVYRLAAGQRLVYANKILRNEFYHMFRNIPEHSFSLEECINEGDRLFRQAVDRIFRKNVEYGYQCECDLSGGLDSRMATWVAHDLGYKDVLNICYCVEGNLDHTVSKQIAEDLGNSYLFIPMDGSVFEDGERKVELFGGQVDYIVCTGALKALDAARNKNLGCMCTGLLGELQNAYWIESADYHTAPGYYDRDLRTHLFKLNISEQNMEQYENYEQMNLYEHSANMYLLSALVRQQEVEVSSPFIDVDYLDFIYKVPLRWRANYGYVKKWMTVKYPKSTQYIWQHTGSPVNDDVKLAQKIGRGVFNAEDYAKRFLNKVLRIAKINYQLYRKQEMNPVNTWYRNSESLRSYLDNYYADNINRVMDNKMKDDLMQLFQEGNAFGKLEVVNILAIYKLYL